MDRLRQDLRFAFRTCFKSPAFTVVAVLTLALGIGTTSAMFTVVSGVLLRELPYRDPEGVVVVWGTDVDGRFGVSERERERYVEQTELFESFGAWDTFWAHVSGDGEAVRLVGAALNAEVLPVLGVSPVLGRGFLPEEDRPGEDDVALLSYGLWQSRFGGSRAVLEETVVVNGRRRQIVGVLPRGFRLPGDFLGAGSQIYVPLALDAEPDPRNIHYLRTVGRLRDGVTLSSAQEQLAALSERLVEEIGTLPPQFLAAAVPVQREILGEVRPVLLVLFAAVGFVLLIACVNVANLYLARSDGRQRELGIRAALGAGRGRLIGQLFAESLVLAAIGGTLGVLLAVGATRAVIALDPPNLPRVSEIGVDLGVVGFTAFVTVVAACLFGLAPILKVARGELGAAKGGYRGATAAPGRDRLRRALVVAEVALTLMLATGAGLLVRSFVRLQGVEPGFEPEGVLTLELSLPPASYTETGDARGFYRELLDRVRALPSVIEAGAVSHLPLASDTGDWGVRIEGREEERLASGRRPWAERIVTTDGYFEALQRPLVEGRLTSEADLAETRPVVVINETMSRRYWPEASPVGKRFKLSSDIDPVYRTVIGVVGDVPHDGLDADVRPEMYLPHAQFPASSNFTVRSMSLVIRAAVDPLALAPAVREEVAALDTNVPVSRVQSMNEVVRSSTSTERLSVALFGFFGVLGLLLVSVGVYGVMAYVVSTRAREVGIRMALGARPRTVLRSVLGQGLSLGVVGTIVGIVGSLFAGRIMNGLLYDVSWYDPTTLTGVTVLVLTVALGACYFPARRATRVDPVEVLRCE